jgi:hypothetical protein
VYANSPSLYLATASPFPSPAGDTVAPALLGGELASPADDKLAREVEDAELAASDTREGGASRETPDLSEVWEVRRSFSSAVSSRVVLPRVEERSSSTDGADGE